MANTYARLNSGDWGIRIEGRNVHGIKVGEVVDVRTKAGKRNRETITAVVWTDGKVALASIVGRDIAKEMK